MLSFSASDPGADTISSWRIDLGDGSPEIVLPGSATQAVLNLTDTVNDYDIQVTATDEDGSYDATPFHVDVTHGYLEVTSLTPTSTGFKVRFR